MEIQFGTDGWRARIAEAYTFENVRRVALATARFWKSEQRQRLSCYSWKPGTYACTYRPADQGIVIGYDARFLSEDFALEAAKVVASQGIPVLLSQSISPTPTTSFAIAGKKLSGGIMITASHNPYAWNGFKIKMEFGGSSLPEITQGVEQELKTVTTSPPLPPTEAGIQKIDLLTPYLNALKEKVDFPLIEKNKIKMSVDPLFGTNAGIVQKLLPKADIHEIHGIRNPMFGGLNPEPIDVNLQELMNLVPKEQAAVGLAFDGDGDRIGAVDEKGNFLSSHEIFCLLLWHLVKHKKWSGGVAKTISTTNRVTLLAKHFGLEAYETPIGFKHICKLFLTEDILIGGEESGGIGIKNHIPERDSLLNALLLLELMAVTGKKLGEVLNEIHETVGFFCTDRIDLTLPPGTKETVLATLTKQVPSSMEGTKILETSALDGVKYHLENHAWILFRPSGTEPLIRIYAEAGSKTLVTRLLEAGKKMILEAGHLHTAKN